jgi:hypothetical protein
MQLTADVSLLAHPLQLRDPRDMFVKAVDDVDTETRIEAIEFSATGEPLDRPIQRDVEWRLRNRTNFNDIVITL